MKQSQAGFSLTEILVAITMLAFALMGVAQLSYPLARRFYGLSGSAARSGIVAQQANPFAAMPFDSLQSRAGTTTVAQPPMPFTRIVSVDSIAPNLRRVTIVIRPTDPAFRPDTVVIGRSQPSSNLFGTL